MRRAIRVTERLLFFMFLYDPFLSGIVHPNAVITCKDSCQFSVISCQCHKQKPRSRRSGARRTSNCRFRLEGDLPVKLENSGVVRLRDLTKGAGGVVAGVSTV